MNVMTALYQTYNDALKHGLVDQVEEIDHAPVLLPLYHASKRSDGKNIVVLTLNHEAQLVKAAFMPKLVADTQIYKRVIFPVTETSIVRTGGIFPHAICDYFSYVTPRLNDAKYNQYIKQLEEWLAFDASLENPHPYLPIIHRYISRGDIFPGVIAQLFTGQDPVIDGMSLEVAYTEEEKVKKLDFKNIFVEFCVEPETLLGKNFSVTTDKQLHENFTHYRDALDKNKARDICNISGDRAYCISKHRGLLGTGKIISLSENTETYRGRFSHGEEVVSIGNVASEKAHAVLNYLLENKDTATYLGDSTYLLTWFSSDVQNKVGMHLTRPINPLAKKTASVSAGDDDSTHAGIGSEASRLLLDVLSGKKSQTTLNTQGHFYVMIIHLINKGRISIKYFRALGEAELYDRVAYWYETTKWPLYHTSEGAINLTPSLYRYANVLFGTEDSNKRITCMNEKLKRKTVERLVVCMIDKKALPNDFAKRMLANLYNRSAYFNTWRELVDIGCSILKKHTKDRNPNEEVNAVLNSDNTNRSYLYGRLLAIYEKLEMTADNAGGQKLTNAERMWTSFVHAPAKGLLTLTHKLLPYQARLKKYNYGLSVYYEKLITEVINKIHDTEDTQDFSNKALDEHFVFGYYAQMQSFYTKKEQESDTEEETSYANA